MNKSKFLKFIILGLLISNGILAFMLINGRNKKDGPKNIIIEKLHLDKEQIKTYETYIAQHRKAINANEITMNKLRGNLYQELKHSQDTAIVDSLISIIANQQTVAEHINYNHFLEIKKLCKPSQKEAFNNLTTEIANLFSSDKRK
jgi:periplasmic protein CpxP/Spy